MPFTINNYLNFSDIELTPGDKKTLYYTTHVLGGLGFKTVKDSMPYETFVGILKRHSEDEIMAIGSTAVRFVKENITRNVVDL